ncbi:hypothetical protein CNMCM6106_002392 [Aspergillus hiratsukae]|uniref:Uncharacterized protein n=1 Tax=Aspergillus hiratsukae TaxID=1194566 RepID=A0A8H6Q576_9EURO|nr:hypothetical protein CNMCM6106_002392 [Aspergillus hiratsukae]
MFSWSTNFQDLYQLQGDSDTVTFATNFASDELSLEQPNLVPARDNTTPNGPQVRPQLASPIQHSGGVSRLELEQREEMMTSIPLDNDAGRRQETDTIFATTWDETSQNTARFNGIVQQLNNHTRQLNGDAQLLNGHAKRLGRLTKAVEQLEKSVGRLEERCNEARQRVEDIASALVNTDRHFRFLVQRLSTPLVFDARATENEMTDDANNPSSE